MNSGKETRSIFLAGVHHAYAQTDGTYAWPNSREGDLLRQGMREVEHLRAELAAMREQRDEARREVCWKEKVYNREHGYEPTDERLIAAERGWDCYKEGGGA